MSTSDQETEDIRPELLTAAESFDNGDYERAESAVLEALGTVRKYKNGDGDD